MGGALRANAQQAREAGLQALVALSDPTLAVAGAYGAIRTSERTRIAVTLGAGVLDNRFTARGELLGHFLLTPRSVRGPGVYGGGGIAAVSGAVDEGYVVLLLGIEARPGERSGWALEVGVGGGVRLTGGYRWRWFR